MLRRRSRSRTGPGVVGTVARTAVIAGTATAVSHGVSGRMASKAQQTQQAQGANQAAAQSQAAASPPPGPQSGADVIAQLQQLGEMKTAGLLTDAEFEAAKARVLGS